MKTIKAVVVALICGIFLISFINAGEEEGNASTSKKHLPRIYEETEPDLNIKEGYVSQKKETVQILRNGKVVAKVKLGKPIVVAQAEHEEDWGYFQFPGICRGDDGRLFVSWQMNEDSHKAYGKAPKGRAMSLDEGKTWEPLDQKYFIRGGLSLDLKNGDLMQIVTPTSKDITQYESFPKPVYRDQQLKMDFYLEKDLPEDLRGTYLNIRDGHTKTNEGIHGVLEDPGLMRYAIDGLMPLMWWGEIEELEDGSLIGGIYRTYYQDQNTGSPKSCITFYKSQDGGYHWKAIGRISYQIEEIKDRTRKYDSTRGFSEATFEILKDGTYFCVLRTGYNTPMYKSYSKDGGQHWTKPVAFTSNGVMPHLIQLDNGVMVLASGRPGLQLRFCLEGDGKVWTEPIEMLPYMNDDGEYDMWAPGCGYPRLLKAKDNVFYMVYSDFKTKNKAGKDRKSIMFRKIEVVNMIK